MYFGILVDYKEYVFLHITSNFIEMVKRIVITGGPGTGKTVLIKMLEALGFHCYHEIIRELTQEAKIRKSKDPKEINPLAFVSDPLAFNSKLLNGRIAQFKSAMDLHNPVVFYDRGIPDVLAYMNYFKQSYDEVFINPSCNMRYNEVILLPPWKEIYVQDNERMENFEQACKLHLHLERQYIELGYSPIVLETGTPEFRLRKLLAYLNLDNES
jgi:predicted ATPase